MAASSNQLPCAIAWGEHDQFIVPGPEGTVVIHGRPFALLPGGSMFQAQSMIYGIAGADDSAIHVIGIGDVDTRELGRYATQVAENLLLADEQLPEHN